jgi:UDP-glucuronate decarboxylase
MKKCLVSGGNGFLGSHLIEKCLENGLEVTVVDNFSTMKSSNLPETVNIIDKNVEDFYTEGNFDYVVHLAARPSPEDYIAHPVDTLMSNSLGTLRMLEIARKSKGVFMYTSSSETYGNASIIPTPETYWGNVNFTGVRSCYDEGKRYSEALIMAYMRQFGLDTRIQRPFNVYGPGIRPDGQYGRVVPRFILQALKDEDITVHGKGDQTRSFLYVDDWVEATWKFLTKSGLKGEILNIGSNKEITILELAKIIIEVTGSSSKIVHLDSREDDPFRRSADISKARKILDWTPNTELEVGLINTVKWVRDNYL